jgi:V/A-type H+/Na+-transporting ATPase subunit D
MGRPARDLAVELDVGRVWGVPVARVQPTAPVARTLEARGTMPGAWGPAAVDAADRYERLVEHILDAAPRELLIRALGQALARTTRQLNTLEQAVAPALATRARTIARGLDEREREDHLRLRRLSHRSGTSRGRQS